jgi:hypothetical protein
LGDRWGAKVLFEFEEEEAAILREIIMPRSGTDWAGSASLIASSKLGLHVEGWCWATNSTGIKLA